MSKIIEQRNKEMYADYMAHLRNGVPVMDIYAILSLRYGIDSDYLRRIIRKEAKRK
jgi:hypothetical protein